MEEEKRQKKDSLLITVFGDSESLESAAQHLFPEVGSQALEFKYYKRYEADYLITFDSHPSLVVTQGWHDVLATSPVHETFFHGSRVNAVYKVPPFTFPKPLILGATEGHRHRGHVGRVPGRKESFVVARPSAANQHSDAGYLYFTTGYLGAPGRYTIKAEVISFDPPEGLDDYSTVAELKLERCKTKISLSETMGDIFTAAVECPIHKAGRIRPMLFWSGSAPFALRRIQIERRPLEK
jgi:hypothetical protein